MCSCVRRTSQLLDLRPYRILGALSTFKDIVLRGRSQLIINIYESVHRVLFLMTPPPLSLPKAYSNCFFKVIIISAPSLNIEKGKKKTLRGRCNPRISPPESDFSLLRAFRIYLTFV